MRKIVVIIIVCWALIILAGGYYWYATHVAPPGECSDIANADECYTQNALSSGESRACSFIGDREKREMCFALVDADLERCSLTGDLAPTCYTQLSLLVGDSFCNNIEQLAFKESCLSNLAMNQTDEKWCTSITTNATRFHCYQSVALVTEDTSICAEIKGGRDEVVNARDECYREIAVAVNDYNLCNPVSPINKDACYFDVAKEHNNGRACSQITSPELRGACYNSIN